MPQTHGLNGESPFLNLFTLEGQNGNRLDMEKLAANWSVPKTGWSVPEAYLGLLLATAFSDGGYTKEEQEEVLRVAKRSPVLSRLSMQDLAEANNAVTERFRSHPEAVRECCETLPDEMKLAVLGHCVEIATADGQLHRSEMTTIERIVEHLGVDTKKATHVVEHVLMMARY